jgi:uncharacterized protein YbcV (DUF1398 family)
LKKKEQQELPNITQQNQRKENDFSAFLVETRPENLRKESTYVLRKALRNVQKFVDVKSRLEPNVLIAARKRIILRNLTLSKYLI